MPSPVFSFTQSQINVASAYAAAGNYQSMYQSLSAAVTAGGGDPQLANWLSTAADINAGEGFYADFVRGAMYEAGRDNGVFIDSGVFQEVSNNLAESVFGSLNESGGLSLDGVITSDVAMAVGSRDNGGFGLPMDSWGGTVGAAFPVGVGGLGLDPQTSQFYTQLDAYYAEHGYVPIELAGRFFELLDDNLAGVTHALSDPNTRSQILSELSDLLGDAFDPTEWSDLLDRLEEAADGVADGTRSIWDRWFDPLYHEIFDPIQEYIDDLIESIKDIFDNAESLASPLIIDLDGDGVETISVDAGANFDHDGNGFAEGTGWVGSDDGLLVVDRNGNGVIDNGSELFGNGTMLLDGELAANGFVALADFDTNDDGVVNATDSDFGSLRVWRDTNRNGVTDAGELLALSEAGVASINTGYTATAFIDEHRNYHLQSGTYTRTNGTIAGISDVWFQVDYADTVTGDINESIVVSEEIEALPDVVGFGNVVSLHNAMAADGSGVLQGLVEQFVQSGSASSRHAIVEQILLLWTGAGQYTENSRGNNLADGRTLYVLEAFLGEAYSQGGWGSNPGPQASQLIVEAYATLSSYVYGQLMLQSHLASWVDQIGVSFEGGVGIWNVSSIVGSLEDQYLNDPTAALATLTELGSALYSLGDSAGDILDALRASGDIWGSEFEVALATIDKLSLRGSSGHDSLVTWRPQNVALFGMAGNDVLQGNDGNDYLDGGQDNDSLTGGSGSDIYLYRIGDGQDTINNYDTSADRFDVLLLGEGISPTGVTATRLNNSLILSINGTTDRITVTNYFESDGAGGYQLDQIRFADGTIWTVEVLKPLVQVPTEGSDHLYGYAGSDALTGLAGNDAIYGYGGDDALEGSAGNDNLSGGAGSDTYIFNAGDGQDTIDNYDNSIGRVDAIELGEGISAADVTARRSGNNLILTFAGSSDRITVANYFDSDAAGHYRLDEIRFADGTIWDVQVVKDLVQVPTEGDDALYGYETGEILSGLGGADTLFGYGGNDRLIGGSGNDMLTGGAGSDVYVFNPGDGQETINNYDTSANRLDAIEFGASIAVGDVTARRSGEHLVLTINGTDDRVTVSNYFSQDAAGPYRLDEIRFADGTVWNIETVMALVQVPTEGADTLYGYATNDNLTGAGGNDTLYGYGGNDVLAGGSGNDTLDGGIGSDTYLFDLGDGQDTINNYDTSSGRTDVLLFGQSVDPADVTVRRVNGNLVLTVNGTDDRVTISNYFNGDAAGGYQLEEIRFAGAPGTVWDVNAVRALVLAPTSGDDTLQGYASNDIIAGGNGNDTIYGNAGDDVLQGESGNDVLHGGAGHDTLMGDEGIDTLNGDVGDDVLQGGAGNDSLNGGVGSDTYRFNAGDGQDVINNYDTSAGRVDVLQLGEGILSTDVTARRSNNDLVLTFAGSDDRVTVFNYFIGDAAGNYQLDLIRFADDTTWDVETVMALVLQPTGGADTLQGYAGDDIIAGGAGNDILYGNAGNDTLHGQDGNDTTYGGAGDDMVTGGAGVDALHGDAGDDVLDGGADNDILRGGSGTDHLTGGLGNDQLEGGEGDDHYNFAVGDGQDTISDTQGLSTLHLSGLPLEQVYLRRDGTTLVLRFTGSSTDQIRLVNFFDASTQLALRGLVIDTGDGTPWSLNATAVDAAVLLGTALNDVIDGNTLDNTIAGLAGDDTLRGGAGTDSLDGGAGNDVLYGQDGNDVLVGGDGNDLLDGGAGADQLAGGDGDDTYVVDHADDLVTEAAGVGVDTVLSSVSFVLRDSVEHLTLTGSADIDGTGNVLENTLTGNSGNNHLQGLDGNDVLTGNAGDDVLEGGVGNDQLDGGYGADVLEGGAGNDVLDGSIGIDQLVGGAGDDTYRTDQSGDVIVEQTSEGTDVVLSTAYSYELSTNIEQLTLVEASGAYTGTGNALDNLLTGNSNDNYLDGGAGADTIIGGLGNDIYVVDNVGDVIVENAGEGVDSVESSIDYTLGSTLENLALLGDANLNGTGNEQDNVLRGNTGNNRLDGGAGGDDLYGGEGDDYLVNDSSGDWIYEHQGEGTDTIERRYETNLVLSNNVENLILATGVTTGHGNNLDNVITGNAGANNSLGLDGADQIYGLDGNDSMWGGVGADRLFGGNGDDYMEGDEDDDYLEGGAGHDQMEGGTGIDTLVGGTGDDKYIAGAGTGTDIVDNTGGGFDGIFFREGVTAEQLVFTRDGDDLLIAVTGQSAPAMRVRNHFLGGDAAIDYVQPDGGFYLTTAQINQIVAGGGTGGQYDQVIEGTASGEQLVGSSGKDLIKGLAGDDTLFGMGGNDTLQGGDGADYLAGGNGSGTGSGADRLEGDAGDDTLSGEDGANVLIGGVGNDSYVYGGGQDTIDNTGGGNDGVFFNDGITAENLAFTRVGDNLVITANGNASATVTVTNHFLGGDYAIDFVQPSSGNLLNTAAINALVSGGGTPGGGGNPGNDADYPNVVTGTASGEQLLGTSGRDLIRGLAGNDTLFGFGGDDKFEGGDGDDYLSGGNGSYSGSGNDILIGGAGVDTLVGEDGNDIMVGGTGNDKYVYGGGSDTIDNVGGGTDWVFFNSSSYKVARNRMTFHRDGDDLLIRVDGDASKQIRVQKHFLGGEYAISYVQPDGGNAISASSIAGQLTPLQSGAQASRAMGGNLTPTTESLSVASADCGLSRPTTELEPSIEVGVPERQVAILAIPETAEEAGPSEHDAHTTGGDLPAIVRKPLLISSDTHDLPAIVRKPLLISSDTDDLPSIVRKPLLISSDTDDVMNRWRPRYWDEETAPYWRQFERIDQHRDWNAFAFTETERQISAHTRGNPELDTMIAMMAGFATERADASYTMLSSHAQRYDFLTVPMA